MKPGLVNNIKKIVYITIYIACCLGIPFQAKANRYDSLLTKKSHWELGATYRFRNMGFPYYGNSELEWNGGVPTVKAKTYGLKTDFFTGNKFWFNGELALQVNGSEEHVLTVNGLMTRFGIERRNRLIKDKLMWVYGIGVNYSLYKTSFDGCTFDYNYELSRYQWMCDRIKVHEEHIYVYPQYGWMIKVTQRMSVSIHGEFRLGYLVHRERYSTYNIGTKGEEFVRKGTEIHDFGVRNIHVQWSCRI